MSKNPREDKPVEHPNGRMPPNPMLARPEWYGLVKKKKRRRDPDKDFKVILIIALGFMILVGIVVGFSGN